ncbi:LCP family protein [Paenibacillus sp. UMB4589-SE434]|uniref:LCP family protein n=1 Tax=Paenibacillus sp. UMB4589-SE434 TaxID=3046314 RepID=UPI002550C629|nr:LCP family protein [Paenibacillus sp. UMB4589-SE434]MDK8180963.1 LCP family protein [Paenibacillus sp. UMB4589-SE434]
MSSKTPLPPRQTARKQTKPAVKKRKGMPTWLKWLLTIIMIVLIVIIGYATYILLYGNSKLDKISTVTNKGGGTSTVTETLSPQTEPFSFVLMGIDYRKELPGLRTDVVMVGALHPKTKEAVLVSLPRDTYFQVGEYRADKLNHFYPKFHEMKKHNTLESASPEDEMKIMLGQYLGMKFDHAAVINFQGFVDVVNALDGIEVNVDQNMCYRDRADGTNINLKAGFQEIDGQQALDFVRYRKSNCSPMTKGTTDFDRNMRQNAVLQELVGKMQSLGGITKVTSIIDALADNFKMDMTPDQMRSSIMTYLDINRKNIHYISVDGEWKSPYIYVNDTKLQEAKQALEDVLAGKSLATTSESSTSGDSNGSTLDSSTRSKGDTGTGGK